MSGRTVRSALAVVTALLVAGGLAGCGRSHNPGAYHQGFTAGLAARHRFIQQQGPTPNFDYLCAQEAYKAIQDMASSRAVFWQNGFDMGCANEST